mmetsp:Transcript_27248/g.26290  ORF Transcript_27248/g.26290 Transcript_27248/m.26290 type:complete len:260 (-) Transcript_27248:31-810(-)
MPGLQDPYPTGEPIVGVGTEIHFAPGGTTGSVLRPFALKKCVDTAINVPQVDIFGSGGIISGDHSMSFLQYGAKALQICSAVQNMDAATVYYDLTTSLQANMYLLNNPDLRKQGWRGQVPPDQFYLSDKKVRPSEKSHKIPAIKDLVASKLKHVSPIEKMNQAQSMVPVINEDACLQCGRCYLACSDSGYQAIAFQGYDHFPEIIEKDCTGCSICYAVCPVQDAIYMKPRKTEYTVKRGTELPPNYPQEHNQTYPPWIY